MNKLTAFIKRIHLISAFLEYVGVSNGNVITLCLKTQCDKKKMW